MVASACAAQAVRIARRDGLRSDHEQDAHDELACSLDGAGVSTRPPCITTPAIGTVAAFAAGIVATGKTLPYPGSVVDVSAALTDPVLKPQPHARDLILEVIHDLDRGVLQAQTDGYLQGLDIKREQSAALQRFQRGEVI